MGALIDEQALAELCPEISTILNAELDAGNHLDRIYRTEQSVWPKPGSIVVHLKNRFFTNPSPLPADVRSGGPDYQCGIGNFYQCELHDHLIMDWL